MAPYVAKHLAIFIAPTKRFTLLPWKSLLLLLLQVKMSAEMIKLKVPRWCANATYHCHVSVLLIFPSNQKLASERRGGGSGSE